MQINLRCPHCQYNLGLEDDFPSPRWDINCPWCKKPISIHRNKTVWYSVTA